MKNRFWHTLRVAGAPKHWATAATLVPLLVSQRPAGAATHALHFNGANQYVELPLGEQLALDDAGPGFYVAPAVAWSASPVTNAFRGQARQTTNVDARATWIPRLPRAGSFHVYAWWGNRLSNGTQASLDPAAQYVVKHADGATTNMVNQNTAAGQWTYLGTFDFLADRSEFVRLEPGPAGSAPTVADAIQFISVETFNVSRALTIEAWVNVAAFDQKSQAVVTKGEAWGLMRHNDTDQLTFRTFDGTFFHDVVSTQSFATGRWYHVAAVFDGARKTLYVDGVVSATAQYTEPLAQNIYPVVMGANAETTGRDFHGQLDTVRLWSIARRAEELAAVQTNRLRGTEAGLLGEWRFDESSGLLAWDNSLGALHGTLRKTASPPTRVAGVDLGPPLPGPQALRFDGYDHYVALPVAAKFDFTNQFTVEMWVYPDFAPMGDAALISKGANAWELVLAANSKLVFRTAGLRETDPSGGTHLVPAVDLASATRLDPQTWYHVAVTWNGATGTKEIYVNGQLDQAATNLVGQVAVNASPVVFAARPAGLGTSHHFRGLLDEVRLWNTAQPGAQINANYARDLNRSEPGLLGIWDFNEGDGTVARDGRTDAPSDGTLSASMSNLNRVDGVPVASPLPLQYSLNFEGTNEFVQINLTNAPGQFNLTNLTIEAWVKPIGTGFRNILMKGDHGYGLAIDQNNHLRYFIDSTTQNSLRSDRPLEVERDADSNPILDAQGRPVVAWNHVGVVVDRAANTTTFYINGKPAGTHASSVIRNNNGPIVLGRQGSIATANYFEGQMDEVRLWSVPRTSLEVQLFAFNALLGTGHVGLIGYWTFNEGSGGTLRDGAGQPNDGVLVNMDLSNWRAGTDWGLPPLDGATDGLTPNPAAAGLWLGQVVVDQVNEVQRAIGGVSENVTTTPNPATLRLLLHVAANGQVRLLKDVIVMRKGEAVPASGGATNPLPPVVTTNATNPLVLVTRPELIPNFQGVMLREGKLVGVRYGTATYDFEGTELPLLGGVGAGGRCRGRIDLGKDHPTNPYRHKYHPDHRSGFDLTRQFSLEFAGQPGDPLAEGPGYGVDRLTGVYRETITGLHKIPLKVEGTVTLNRVNTVGTLNGTD